MLFFHPDTQKWYGVPEDALLEKKKYKLNNIPVKMRYSNCKRLI